ncbi:MAG: phospholipase, partial [Burkholderiales bacterium]|nr:phospholipase [Burkholderiales bacterium]
MADPNTIRILEIDGGGQRGYFSLNWLDRFIQLWGIDPATIANQFDVICGTSVGGIMALSLASGMTPAEMYPFFETQGPYIFSLSSLFASYRPNAVFKTALVATDTPFYQSSGPTEASYGAGLLKATVQSTFGAKTLQDLNTNVVITSYEQDTSTFRLFSNANVSGYIGQNTLASDVALATSAAPVYLPAWTIGSHTYLDGGVYNNNPSQFGVSLGKILKPTAKRICLLSIGTGRGEYGFDPSGNPDPPADCTDP